MQQQTVKGFFDELEKIADIMTTYGKGRGTGDPRVTAAGVFIGPEDPNQSRARQLEFQQMLGRIKSLQQTRAAYAKKYPKDYVTLAFRRDYQPGGFMHRMGKLFGTEASKEREAQWALRQKPRLFMSAGPAGSPMQAEFYRDVSRGLHEHELDKMPAKEKKVWEALAKKYPGHGYEGSTPAVMEKIPIKKSKARPAQAAAEA